MDVQERRSLIITKDNPDVRVDYVSLMSAAISPTGFHRPLSVSVRYVPDRYVLAETEWRRYLDVISELEFDTVERIATTIVADTNDVLIPRWIEVTVQSHGEWERFHASRISDRQPGWDNPQLLASLPGFEAPRT